MLNAGCSPVTFFFTRPRRYFRIEELETVSRTEELKRVSRIEKLETVSRIEELETVSRIEELETVSRIEELETDPDSKSRNIPEVVIVRRGQLGFWEFGKGGTVG